MNFWCWTARNPFPLAAELNSFAQKFWQIFLPILFRLLGSIEDLFPYKLFLFIKLNSIFDWNYRRAASNFEHNEKYLSAKIQWIFIVHFKRHLINWTIFFCWSHQFQTYWDFYWNQRGKIKERNKWHSVLILRNQKFIVKKRINSRKRYVWHWNNSLYNFFKHSTKYYREYCLKWGWKISANQQTRREILQSINMSINQLCLSILHFFEKKNSIKMHFGCSINWNWSLHFSHCFEFHLNENQIKISLQTLKCIQTLVDFAIALDWFLLFKWAHATENQLEQMKKSLRIFLNQFKWNHIKWWWKWMKKLQTIMNIYI